MVRGKYKHEDGDIYINKGILQKVEKTGKGNDVPSRCGLLG